MNYSTAAVNITTSIYTSLVNETTARSGSSSIGGSVATISPSVVVNLIIGAVGVLGNLFASVIFILHEPLHKRIPHLFLINQNFLDLFVGAMLMIMTGLSLVNTSRAPVSGLVMCYIVNSRILFTAPMDSSTWNLVAMSFERYAEIVHPVKHKLWISRRKIINLFVATWIAGFLYKGVSLLPSMSFSNGICRFTGVPSITANLINAVTTPFLEFIGPCLAIVFCYVKMAWATRKIHFNTAGSGQQHQQPHGMSPVSKNIRKIMTTIIITMMISLGPKQLGLLFSVFFPSLFDPSGLAYGIFVFISYANCCFNPFIYLFKFEEFRRGIRVVILGRKTLNSVSGSAAPTQDTQGSKY